MEGCRRVWHLFFFFFFKRRTAYDFPPCLVAWELFIRDRPRLAGPHQPGNLALAIAMLRHQRALTIPPQALSLYTSDAADE